MSRFLLLRSITAVLSVSFPFFCASQCPAINIIGIEYLEPYRAWIAFAKPVSVDYIEYEIVHVGQAFSGQPSGTLQYFGNDISDLTPNTTYAWRVRSVCGSIHGAWGANLDTFCTPPPCPPALELALDSTLTMNFPAPISENAGFMVCYEPAASGSYLWGFKAPFPGYFRLQVTDSGGKTVHMGYTSGAHPDCGGIDNCVSLQSPLNNKYDFYLQGGDSIYFNAGYPFDEGPTWRTVKITERPCPPPTGINVDSITLNSARLVFNNNNQMMDIEFVEEEESFTGVPNYPSLTNSLILNNLMPQTGYKWQIRSNCLPQNISPWFNGTTFETGPICDSMPVISCDTVLNIHLKAGKSITYQATPFGPGQ